MANKKQEEAKQAEEPNWAYLLFAFDDDSVKIGHGATLNEAQAWKIDQAGFNEIMQAAKAFYMAALNGTANNR